MYKNFLMLVINPGSTSTKVSVFSNLECKATKSLQHSSEELEKFAVISDQYEFRKKAVTDYLSELSISARELDAVVGRGGLLRPLKGGTYLIGNTMLDDLKSMRYGQHASNLGAIISYEIAASVNKPSYIVNPVVVDEMEPLARFSGHPEIPRKSVFHALNQKAVAKRASADMGMDYNGANMIIAHLGGGISVAAHKKGRVIDVNNGLEEGPFSPERTGSLPVIQLMELCYSGRYTKNDMKKLLVGKGGLAAYLGTTDCVEIEQQINNGNTHAHDVFEALAYQVSKEIAALGAVLYGKVDAVVLTGGLARSKTLTGWITERVNYLAKVLVYPGEDEMHALAEGALRVLTGEETALEYDNA